MAAMSFRRALGRLALAPLALALALAPAGACTSFLLKAADGARVYGRTLEFGFPLESEAIVIPRNHAARATGPDGKPGWGWKSRYAIAGLNAFGLPVVVDGMNEKGLAGGILYFPGFAGYADPKTADAGHALAPWDFLTWALGNFASVEELRAALDTIAIVDIVQPNLGIVPPFHYTLHDANGASLVVEPIGGRLKIYENPLGVVTNAPSFDWHLTNLRNYVKLSPVDAPPLKIAGESFAPLGAGSGLLGIPGDPTPPSRFVRAVGMTLSAEPQKDAAGAVRLAEHILNNFDIPLGLVRVTPQDTSRFEFTQWSSIADLSGRVYYVKSYDNQTLRSIDLTKSELEGRSVRAAPLRPSSRIAPVEFPKH
ncbi:choloylglycine hydrolase family protein [Methylosinus sp. PW1]|uniref:choloylglycine hydrolase family protein n=1 Tax=Methylosinus sp. PW1 TaxID=107636 RepID=UPI000B0DCBA1|nr:choloylglycine hydrolase family protein [Methylosinus sp. PW1]